MRRHRACPASGVRLVPSGRTGGNTALSSLARLRGQGGTWSSTPVIQTENGAHHYRLQFLEIDGKNQEGYETLIALGNNTTQTSTGLAPYNITFDRVYIHGDPVRGQKRCLALDSASTNILNSYFEHCKHFASDAQAIARLQRSGPVPDRQQLPRRIDREHPVRRIGPEDPEPRAERHHDHAQHDHEALWPGGTRSSALPAARASPHRPQAARWRGGTHYFKVVALLAFGWQPRVLRAFERGLDRACPAAQQ